MFTPTPSSSAMSASGPSRPFGLEPFCAATTGPCIVGERTSVQDNAVIHAVAEFPTVIGSDCVIGHIAHLEGCTIHDGALVGSGSIVLHHSQVHSGATVGAGCVVTNNFVVPANALAVGVPAKVKENASSAEMIAASAAVYVDNARRYGGLLEATRRLRRPARARHLRV
jgi:carbonic anhydrase/acetyltransferase-like protein (isoleucine patch superfamily)